MPLNSLFIIPSSCQTQYTHDSFELQILQTAVKMEPSKPKRQKIFTDPDTPTALTFDGQPPPSGNNIYLGTVHQQYYAPTFQITGVSSDTLAGILSTYSIHTQAPLADTVTSSSDLQRKSNDALETTHNPANKDADDHVSQPTSSPLRKHKPPRLFSKKPAAGTTGGKHRTTKSPLSVKQKIDGTPATTHSFIGLNGDDSDSEHSTLENIGRKPILKTPNNSNLPSTSASNTMLDRTTKGLTLNFSPGTMPEDPHWPHDDQTKPLVERVSTLYRALREFHRENPRGILLSATPPVYLDWKAVKELAPTKWYSNGLIRSLILSIPFPKNILPVIRGYEHEALQRLTDEVDEVYFFEIKNHHWFLILVRLRKTPRVAVDIRIYDPLNTLDENSMENQCSDAIENIRTAAQESTLFRWTLHTYKLRQMVSY